MSYIRAGSNPEALYVIGGSRSRVEIYHSVTPPHASDAIHHEGIVLPFHVFQYVCKRWDEGRPERIRHRGCEVCEVYVFADTGKDVPERFDPRSNRKARFQIRFTYKGRWFNMWQVTWAYIVDGVVRRSLVKKRQKIAKEEK